MKRAMILLIMALCVASLFATNLSQVRNNNLSVSKGETARVELSFTIPAGQYAAFQEESFFTEIDEIAGFSDGNTIYPVNQAIDTDFGYKKFEGTIVLVKEVVVDASAASGTHELDLFLMYQLCLPDGACFAPKEESHKVSITVQ